MPGFDGMNAFRRADIKDLSVFFFSFTLTLEDDFHGSKGVGQRVGSRRFGTNSCKRNVLASRRAGTPAPCLPPGLAKNCM